MGNGPPTRTAVALPEGFQNESSSATRCSRTAKATFLPGEEAGPRAERP